MTFLERALTRLFPSTIHRIVSRQISTAYQNRWVSSAGMHLMAENSGYLCRLPGYNNPLKHLIVARKRAA